MVFETPVFTFIPALLNIFIKVVQTGYEVEAAPTETAQILETIAQTKADIVSAKKKRQQLAKVCDDDELRDFDKAIQNVESALKSLERVVEPARVSMDLNKDKMSAWIRLMWVVRDSNKVLASSSRLTLAQVRFDRHLLVSSVKYDRQKEISQRHHGICRGSADIEGPPSYEKTVQQSMAERREMTRKYMPDIGLDFAHAGDHVDLPSTSRSGTHSSGAFGSSDLTTPQVFMTAVPPAREIVNTFLGQESSVLYNPSKTTANSHQGPFSELPAFEVSPRRSRIQNEGPRVPEKVSETLSATTTSPATGANFSSGPVFDPHMPFVPTLAFVPESYLDISTTEEPTFPRQASPGQTASQDQALSPSLDKSKPRNTYALSGIDLTEPLVDPKRLEARVNTPDSGNAVVLANTNRTASPRGFLRRGGESAHSGIVDSRSDFAGYKNPIRVRWQTPAEESSTTSHSNTSGAGAGGGGSTSRNTRRQQQEEESDRLAQGVNNVNISGLNSGSANVDQQQKQLPRLPRSARPLRDPVEVRPRRSQNFVVDSGEDDDDSHTSEAVSDRGRLRHEWQVEQMLRELGILT